MNNMVYKDNKILIIRVFFLFYVGKSLGINDWELMKNILKVVIL